MAKLTVLHLPAASADEAPFALVLSECEIGLVNSDVLAEFKTNSGARAVLVTDFPIEVER